MSVIIYYPNGSGGGGTEILTAANFSELPLAADHNGEFYWCLASQGTSWLPGTLGGTFYPKGLYYSDGSSWTNQPVPYQATISEVNTGTNDDKFVTPSTFNNASKWDTKMDSVSEFVFINTKSDLPTPSAGVITLEANKTYYFATVVDLTGDRLVGSVNTTILGASSENCIIKSTGLSSSTALITSVYSLPIRNITLTHGTALNLDGDGTTTALDWFGVNFTDCATVGTIKDYTNFIMNDSAFLNSQGLTFDGTIGTIGMTNCLFDCTASGTAIILPSTLTISRRFRIIYSSFVVLSGEIGINASTSATIGDEKYILDTVNFSGGGTYLTGLNATFNKSLFANCVGITNTSTRGFMYMLDNTTATAITGTASYFKASGTTTAMATNSKFTMPSSNRLTYTGAFSQSFMISVNCNVRTSVSTQNINIIISKNGTIITESEMTILCQAGSTPSFGATQIVTEMTTNDYVELFVRNTSSVNNVIVSDMNFNVVKIPV